VHFISPVASFEPQLLLHAVPLAHVKWPAQVPDAPATQVPDPLHVLAATVTLGAVHVAPGQSPAPLHWTHVFPPVLQSGVDTRAAQSGVVLHCTQVLPPVLQTGVGPEQVVLSTHATHVLFDVLQAGVTPEQFALLVHCTQVSVVRLQACIPVHPAAGTAVLLTQTSHLSLNVPPFWSHKKPGAHCACIVHIVLQALFVHEKFGPQAVGAGVGHVCAVPSHLPWV
jgi:hypothetical protein